MIHELKTAPKYFKVAVSGEKTFEVRRDDRGYAVGDILHLVEYDLTEKTYSGRAAAFLVTYLLRTSEVSPLYGFVVMGTAPCNDFTKGTP